MMKQVTQDDCYMLMPGFNYLIIDEDRHLLEVVNRIDVAERVVAERLAKNPDQVLLIITVTI
jgi:hypothetical protein